MTSMECDDGTAMERIGVFVIIGLMYKICKIIIGSPAKKIRKSKLLPGKIRHFNEQMSLIYMDFRDRFRVARDRHGLHHGREGVLRIRLRW